jgi:hypothetical protein
MLGAQHSMQRTLSGALHCHHHQVFLSLLLQQQQLAIASGYKICKGSLPQRG